VTASVREFWAEEILRDGGSIVIRAIRADDKTRLLEHFRRLSAQSVYFRFFGTKKTLSDRELAAFTELDFVERVALVATLLDEGHERIIGVGRMNVLPSHGTPSRAEVAFAVTDDHQGRGIATLLLEQLALIARTLGVAELQADVLSDNRRMLDVFAHSGFAATRTIDSGVFTLVIPSAPSPASIEASLERERHAAAESVRAFLEPRAIAVVGASRDPSSIGGVVLANVRASFQHPIYVVHSTATEVQGVRAFPRVSAIGAPVDLAVIAVPAAAVEEVVADCARAAVRGIVVISSGFGEVGAAGRETEERLRHLARGSGMRLVGPNCMGVINTDPQTGFDATFAAGVPPRGSIAMLSQSGALGLAILDHVRVLNLGISSFVSVGNKADVSSNDLLAYWGEDPHTNVILLYLESFGNPRKFARLAPAVARHKPIIAVKSGRSAAGVRAASSHSASLASLDVGIDALFEQAGVVRTQTLEELFDVAALLSTQPIPPGPRVAVVTNAGGPGILLADACEAQGLVLPELTAETRARLRAFLPSMASVANPIDMTAAATPEQYLRTIETVAADPTADAIIVVYIPILASTEEMAASIARAAGTVPSEKPVLTVFMSSRGAPPELAAGPRGRLPSYGFPENAALALAAAERYGRWRRRAKGTSLVLDDIARHAVRTVIDRVLAGADEPRWLAPEDVTTVLRAVGIRVAASTTVAPTDAVAAAERLGYPLVAKAVAPGVLHKSDVGGVRLGLKTAAEVAAAVEAIADALGALDTPLAGILLQREVADGLEALVGVTSDPTFGPLLVCGLGGVLVEILRDVSFRLTPVTDVDAQEMLASLKGSRLLDGFRGRPAADRDALVDVIRRISALVEVVPELRELDLNPVKVLAPGHGAIVVDGRMRVGSRREPPGRDPR